MVIPLAVAGALRSPLRRLGVPESLSFLFVWPFRPPFEIICPSAPLLANGERLMTTCATKEAPYARTSIARALQRSQDVAALWSLLPVKLRVNVKCESNSIVSCGQTSDLGVEDRV